MLWHHYTIVLYSFLLFFFQKVDVLVSRGAADIADPRQFGHIQLTSLVGGIVAKEARRNIIGGYLRSADLLALCLCVLHAGADSRPNHGQFQLAEHTCHLQESLAHGVGLTVPAVQSDGANNHQPQVLGSDDFDNLTKLLCAFGKAEHFNHNHRPVVFTSPLRAFY